jgi:predicted TIM-barrel fold metal-dependent hydrolase
MIPRRKLLKGLVAAGVAAFVHPVRNVFAKASQPHTPVNFPVPADACDCHVHALDPRRFPFSPARTYTPAPATVAEMMALHRALGTTRVVVVQPSVYGTDNSCTLDAIQQQGSVARGVAVIDDNTPDSALDDMHRAGVRGIRLNLEAAGQTDPAIGIRLFQSALARVKGRPWHVQLLTRLSMVEGMKDTFAVSPVPIVLDHFAGAQAALGLEQPGFRTLLDLVHSGKAYVKISAPYRTSTRAPDYPDVAPLAKALIAANLQRILWGSDWPHPDSSQVASRKATDLAPFFQVDDGHNFNLFATWAPDPAQRKTILVDNPARLYDF